MTRSGLTWAQSTLFEEEVEKGGTERKVKKRKTAESKEEGLAHKRFP